MTSPAVTSAGIACALALAVAGCSPESARFGENSNSNSYGNRGSSRGYAPYPSASSYSPPPRPSSYSPPPAYPSPTPQGSSSFDSEPLAEPGQQAWGDAPSSHGGASYGGGPSYGGSPYGGGPSYGGPSSSYGGGGSPSPSRAPPQQAAPRPYGSSIPPAAAMQYQPLDGPPAAVPRAPSVPPPRSPAAEARAEPPRVEPPRAEPVPPQRVAGLPAASATTANATTGTATGYAPPRPAAGTPGVAPEAAAPKSPAAISPAAGSLPPPAGVAGPISGSGSGSGPAAVSGQTLLPVPPVYTVARGDTLSGVAHHFPGVSPREIAIANGLPGDAPLRVGTRLTIPVKTPVAPARKAPDPRAEPAPTGPAPAAPPVVATVEVVPTGFRWPLRGRIINNFGARVNGAINDGIDLAVPEGTPVRVVEDGYVAYAGNELKGYGYLVLVRHPNGLVTAYANGSELLVKRNDQVHKGQVIMKSGHTGNVTAPQLHFEVRKDSRPVDPMSFLPADKSASAPL